MIKELVGDNLEILNNSFFVKETAIKDLENNPFGHYLVYVDNNHVIAYLYYSDIYERAEVNQIEVDSFHRNCGIGSKMLQEMINIVKKNITLEVKKDNIPAISLYRKFGFKDIAIRSGYYQGIDGILMERKFEK